MRRERGRQRKRTEEGNREKNERIGEEGRRGDARKNEGDGKRKINVKEKEEEKGKET